jgi:S1-C subfamily serine protease
MKAQRPAARQAVYGGDTMKKFALACLMSGLVGLAVGGSLLDEFPSLTLSPEAHAGQGAAGAVVRSERTTSPSSQGASRYSPEEQQNIYVYDVANPSVVNISTQSVVHGGFFGMEGTSEGSGSGSVIDKQGHILTNFHVVDGAERVEATLASGKSYPARLIGHDKTDDLAVLQVDAPAAELHPITFGDSADLKVGQRVYAVGNPFGWERTMTTGIISGLNRTLPSREELRTMKALIQTDAAMNPGNSGGPLLDSTARMIGMNVAIATGRARQNSGVGFAIPVNRIKRQVLELIEHGKVTRGDIGITDVMIVDEGIIPAFLVKGGPAEEAGLRPIRIVREQFRYGRRIYERERYDVENADIITAIDGHRIQSASEFVDAIESRRPGETVTLSILRDGRLRKIDVTLGAS